MNTNILHFLALSAICAGVLCGCDKTEPDNGPKEPETPAQESPVLVIDQTSLNISAEGGALSVSYTVENPAETGTVSAEPDADWIAVETVSSTDVKMNVEANDVTETRTASVNIIYTYGDDSDTVCRRVTVIQEAMIPDPELTLDIESPVTMPVEGGKITIPYTVTYPVEGGTISVKTEVAWITDEVSDTQVTLTVHENQSTSKRTAEVSIVYAYGDGETVSCPVSITQEALEAQYDYYLPNAYLWGELYDYSIANFIYFRVQFSDMEISAEGDITEGACCYDLTIYTSSVVYDDSDHPFPPAGTYTYGTSTMAGEFSGWFYPAEGGSGFGIQEGTMEVSLDGSTMSVDINFTDEQGKTHCVQYSGQPVMDIAFQM